jgi:hypothetical protein
MLDSVVHRTVAVNGIRMHYVEAGEGPRSPSSRVSQDLVLLALSKSQLSPPVDNMLLALIAGRD